MGKMSRICPIRCQPDQHLCQTWHPCLLPSLTFTLLTHWAQPCIGLWIYRTNYQTCGVLTKRCVPQIQGCLHHHDCLNMVQYTWHDLFNIVNKCKYTPCYFDSACSVIYPIIFYFLGASHSPALCRECLVCCLTQSGCVSCRSVGT